MTNNELHTFYNEILDRVLEGQLDLPGLPDIAMEVRNAIGEENTTSETLRTIISKDPGLTAYLVQAVSSPIYRRAVPPKTLAEVVSMLGFSSIRSLVMLHSTRSLVDVTDPETAKLFSLTWERLITKTSIASFLAQQLKFQPVDHVQLALLLSEVGSLTVLSTMAAQKRKIDTALYFTMCRRYSRLIGCAVLDKWEVDQDIVDMVGQCGQWELTWSDKLDLIDIANLALYHTVLMTVDKPTLPALDTLTAYDKLSATYQELDQYNRLALISHNEEAVRKIISAFQ